MITYRDNLENIKAEDLEGFFVGWPNPPQPETHYKILEQSSYIWLAIDEESGKVVGFINAVSDKVLSAYIPLLEVLPDYQGKGIGGELVKAMIDTTKELYMVDLLCDKDLLPFYERFNMFKGQGALLRNYSRQSGK